MAEPTRDVERAERERAARRLLLRAGADDLPRAPWLHPRQPPASSELVRFAVWRGRNGQLTEAECRAGLTLLADARAEIDQLEAAILFTARSLGLTWAQIAGELGLGSAQAAVQRHDRLTSRVAAREGDSRGGPG